MTRFSLAHSRVQPPRGFTLVEMVVALAILGILAALVINGLDGLNQRANFGLQSGDVVSALERTRADAFGRGASTVFVVDTAGKRYWGIRAPTASAATFLDVFDVSNPGEVIISGTLTGGTTFGPATGYGAALPAPYSGVPTLTSGTPAANLAYCSFCRFSGAKAGFGMVLFEPSGKVRFNPDAPSAVGQQVSLAGTSGSLTRIRTVAISAASGAIVSFER